MSAIDAWHEVIDEVENKLYEMEMAKQTTCARYNELCDLLDALYAEIGG